MTPEFKIVAQPSQRFSPLFSLTDGELRARGARRITVEESPGYPCRVSLEDAEVGEQVVLTPFRHHDVSSAYQAVGPIFVREGARTARLEPNTVPTMLLHRLLSVRAYDKDAVMTAARVAKGDGLSRTIQSLFGDARVAYLHIHNAGPGCFNCAVNRA